MNFNADQVGRHMLYFVVNNQPSNMVVMDVFAQAEPGNVATSSNPSAIQTPVTVTDNLNGLTTTTTSNGQTIITATDTTGDKPGNAAGHTGAPGQAGR
jgi:hypothetical protein